MSAATANSHPEVTVISAFGRGELLAGELKLRGFDVALVDVSKALAKRSLADLEGPFPIVRPNPLLPSHLEWLMSHSFEEITNGFCLWLESGPLEMRGPLSNYYSALPAVKQFREFVNPGSALKVGELPFEQRWLIELSYSFASNELRPSTDCRLSGEPFPFQQTMHNPIFLPANVQKIQDEARATGVQWIEAEGVSDIEIERGVVRELELNLGRKQVWNSRYYVWSLSSEETAAISKKTAQKLFPKGAIKSDWAWRRFQVHSAKNPLDSVVPRYLVILKDIYFPWANDNLMILKRRKPDLADLWVRLPSENSRKPDQLKKFTARVEQCLRERFPRWPMEIEAPWDEGPPLYPVFDPENLRSITRLNLSNLIFGGPEVAPRLDWAGRFQKQSEYMVKLQAMKNQDVSKHRKGKSDDHALHAP